MAWVKVPNEHTCRTCGAAIQHWVLLKSDGCLVAEANFCPICYPDVARVFNIPKEVRPWGVVRTFTSSR